LELAFPEKLAKRGGIGGFMGLLKALCAAALFISVYANAMTLDCQAVSENVGGHVRLLAPDHGQIGLSFLLIKNDMTVGRLDFKATPVEVQRANLGGQQVSFLKYFDSVSSPTTTLNSLLFVEKALLTDHTQGLVILQQQNTEQFLCRPATN
jgi:hypothetical protein